MIGSASEITHAIDKLTYEMRTANLIAHLNMLLTHPEALFGITGGKGAALIAHLKERLEMPTSEES